MEVDCPHCRTRYHLAKAPSSRALATCKECGKKFLVDPRGNRQTDSRSQTSSQEPKPQRTSALEQRSSPGRKEPRGPDGEAKWYKYGGLILASLATVLLCFVLYAVLMGKAAKIYTNFYRSKNASQHTNAIQIDYFGGLSANCVMINTTKYDLIDDYIKWVPVLYQNKDFEAISKHILDLLQTSSEDSSYELQTLYMTLSKIPDGKYVEQMLSVLDEWCRKHADSHIPWLVRGNFYIEYAWLIRGGGFAKTVKKDAWPKFHEKLKLAKTDLQHSWELNPNDPNSSSSLIEVAIGLQCPREEMEQYYRNGIGACPWHYQLNSEKLRYLMPKWYGSKEEMLNFGEQCLAVSGEYTYLGLVMVDALNEVHTYGVKEENFLGREAVWPTVEKVYTRFFEKHPDNIRRRFVYAYHAYRAKKYEIALEQFEIIGDRWMMHTTWNSLESYNQCRAFTYMRIGDDYLLAKKLYEKAIDYFEKTVQYNPDAYAYCRLGQAYMYSGLRTRNVLYLKKAEETLGKAVKLGGPNKKYAEGELERLRGYMRRI